MKINEIMAALVAELAADGVPAPLSKRFTLGMIWSDLARLAGEELPPDALVVVERALDATIEPVLVHRGSYGEYGFQFYEVHAD